MLINNTVLGKAPFRSTLIMISVFLTILFTVMRPEVSQGLSFFPRFVFWLLQISTGLMGIVLASLIIRKWANSDTHLVIMLFVTCVIGSLLATPLFMLIDGWFPGLTDDADGWLDTLESQGLLSAMLAEFIEVFPVLLMTWFVVNLPLLLHATFMHPPEGPDEPTTPDEQDARARQLTRDQFFARLPQVVGEDIVSISSDLHYLNVTTVLGSSLILGSLTHVAEAFEEDGLLVHRSHWVNKQHVKKVHIAGNSGYCLMSNDTQVPISRSKRKLVKSYFGQTRQPGQGEAITHLHQAK